MLCTLSFAVEYATNDCFFEFQQKILPPIAKQYPEVLIIASSLPTQSRLEKTSLIKLDFTKCMSNSMVSFRYLGTLLAAT
jgi:hypothetical protein